MPVCFCVQFLFISFCGFSLSSSFEIIVVVVFRSVVLLPLTSPSVLFFHSFSISQQFVSQSSVSSSSVSLILTLHRTVLGSLSTESDPVGAYCRSFFLNLTSPFSLIFSSHCSLQIVFNHLPFFVQLTSPLYFPSFLHDSTNPN